MPVAVSVVVARDVIDEILLGEEIDAGLSVRAGSVLMNVVHEVDEGHRHGVEFLHLVAEVLVAQLDERAELAARELRAVAVFLPDDLGVPVVLRPRLEVEGPVALALHELEARGMDDVLVGVALVGRDVDEPG